MIYPMKKLKKKYYQDRNKIFLKMIKKDFKIWQEENIKFRMSKGYVWSLRYIFDIEHNTNIIVSKKEIKTFLEIYKTLAEQKGYKVEINIEGEYIKLIWEE